MHILKNFVEPTTHPKDSPVELWNLQFLLDQHAQELFGSRNPHKKLYRPTFSSNESEQPCVYNSKSEDGGWAQLSVNAATYWRTTVYELAHETLHLLDPRPATLDAKGSNWLEEGIAVEFSLHCVNVIYGITPPVLSAKYNKAKNLAIKIGKVNFFEKCKLIRQRSGHFADATIDDIRKSAPDCEESIAIKLTKRFDDTPLKNK
ncbi:hypothetical protein ACX3SV_03955 [Hafnia paralvei]|jgi:hypothetical protein